MKEIIIPKTGAQAMEHIRSHSTERQRAAIALSGSVLAVAAAFGLHSAAESVTQDRLENTTYSDPAIGERIENGELDATMFVPVTAVEGDSPASIAARFASDSIDVRLLQSELSGQAGKDGLHPGEVLYLPFEQVDPQTLAHD